MADKVRMIAPYLTVLMDDGAIHEVQCNNFDLVMEERDRVKRKRPGPQEAQMEWITWMAWHGLQREGTIPKTTSFDDFVEHCASIDPTAVETDPTHPAPGAG